MTYTIDNLVELFSTENNPVLDRARKAGEVTREALVGVAREQFAAGGEFVGLTVKQFEALTASKNFDDVIAANQAWFDGSVEILTTHAKKSLEIVQDAAGEFTRAPKTAVRKTATPKRKTGARKKATTRKKTTTRKKVTARKTKATKKAA